MSPINQQLVSHDLNALGCWENQPGKSTRVLLVIQIEVEINLVQRR